ncbi:DNA double-strand break repair nuclease NurA [Methanofollis fontis]|uniref:NurA domain-containing protein n=1 Tax=Methanofollis fontis TaxID=2052832 RepID=A0A483CT18_9EURY|nr:DNA double-strand break repair nuclease NurA [Methanofollis fontis]TAJ44265.1 hypothetical protein CUJ86_09635 [Methanofollis fontis]
MIPPEQSDLSAIMSWMERIRPSDLAQRFAREGGFDAESFQPCLPGFAGHISAVDGSNAMVLESGSFSVAAVRAVETTFHLGARVHAGETPLRLVRIGPEKTNEGYEDLYFECFGDDPLEPLENEDRSRAAAVLRDTLEYWTLSRVAAILGEGDVLLIDGTLRVNHGALRQVMKRILTDARRKGVHIAAVTKAATSTWGDGIPIVQSAEALARESGIHGPWYLEIPPHLLDAVHHREWHFESVYVASLHRCSPRAFKVDLPEGCGTTEVSAVFSALSAYADDGRVTGYPYPLFDAHRLAAITADQTESVRQELRGRMAGMGMQESDYTSYFGDYHDEFARY